MRHLKRKAMPKKWPMPRKGTTFVIKTKFNPEQGVPILIALRDMLGIAQNRKEVKKALHSQNILVNNKIARDEGNAMLLFDVLTIVPSKKSYRLGISKSGKFGLEEIKEGEAAFKIAKLVDKKILKGRRTQLNLSDGRNVLSEVKCNINDSIVINLKDKKIEKCLPLKEKAKVIVVGGKHSGARGVIDKIKLERKMARLNIDGKEINALIKQLMVIE